MIVERVNVMSLVSDPNNARLHNDKNLMAIKGSLVKFGQQKPIVVNYKNIVIAGNGTLEAAIALGWNEIDIVRTDLEGSEAMAYALADNRTAELADWDTAMLTSSLTLLDGEEFDITDIGFDIKMLEKQLDEKNALDDDIDPAAEKFEILVMLGDEAAQREFFDEMNIREIKCVIL